MKKRRILGLLMATVLVLSSSTARTTVFASDNNRDKKEVIYYENQQPDNDTLFDMAMDGELVNNDITQVDVSYQNSGTTKVIKINKKLERETYSDGRIIEQGTSTSLFIQSIPEENKEIAVGVTTYPGITGETGTSGSLTVSNYVCMNYVKMSVDGGTNWAYKITQISSTPTLLDSAFTMTKLYHYCHIEGGGYTSTGASTYMTESDKSFTVNNPSSGTKYYINTGYTKYVLLTDASGGGTTATVTYKRNSTGTLYTFTYPLQLGR